jgi:hypothetical protein
LREVGVPKTASNADRVVQDFGFHFSKKASCCPQHTERRSDNTFQKALTVMKANTWILYRTVVMFVLGLMASKFNASAALVSANTITNDAKTIGLFFDPALTLPSATNLANYSVLTKTGTLPVTSVDVQTNAQFVTLTLSTGVTEFFYIRVTNLVDTATNTINEESLCYISDYGSTDIGVVGDPNPTGNVYTAHSDQFEVTVGGSSIGGTSDRFHFIYRAVIGDFDMSTVVTRLDMADPQSKAGIMARESLATGSRTLQTYLTPAGGSNEVEVAVRTTTNGTTTDAGFQIGPRDVASSNSWLRLKRVGNVFTAYHNADGGTNWIISGVTTQAFSANLLIGLAAASNTTNGMPTTAGFAAFQTTGAQPGDNVLPTLTGSVVGTNMVLNWNRTPRDYMIEACTNVFASPTNWAFLLFPVLEVSTNGRSMEVPLSFAPGSLFMRLRRVERLIPDPPLVLTTGIVLSPGTGGLVDATGAGTSLCSYPVLAAYADALPSGQIIAAKGTPVTFTTAGSDSLVDTVIQVRLPNGVTKVCDSGGDRKARVITSTTQANLTNNYSIIVAPRSGSAAGYSATGVMRVTVTY